MYAHPYDICPLHRRRRSYYSTKSCEPRSVQDVSSQTDLPYLPEPKPYTHKVIEHIRRSSSIDNSSFAKRPRLDSTTVETDYPKDIWHVTSIQENVRLDRSTVGKTPYLEGSGIDNELKSAGPPSRQIIRPNAETTISSVEKQKGESSKFSSVEKQKVGTSEFSSVEKQKDESSGQAVLTHEELHELIANHKALKSKEKEDLKDESHNESTGQEQIFNNLRGNNPPKENYMRGDNSYLSKDNGVDALKDSYFDYTGNLDESLMSKPKEVHPEGQYDSYNYGYHPMSHDIEPKGYYPHDQNSSVKKPVKSQIESYKEEEEKSRNNRKVESDNTTGRKEGDIVKIKLIGDPNGKKGKVIFV